MTNKNVLLGIALGRSERQAPARHTTEVTTTITENRAPTDASVKLLREMESEAMSRVTDRFSASVNGFDCTITIYQSDLDNEVQAFAAYKIGHSERKVKAAISIDEVCPNHEKLYAALHEKVLEDLASLITGDLMRKALH